MLLAVLTVSDRCSRGEMTDTAGPAVVHLLKKNWPSALIQTAIVPDDEEQIVSWLQQWHSLDAALIVTTGGTGLGPRDRTPEATRRVITREAPGLAEAMRVQGAEKTEYAWLSRGVAGLMENTLIINLPGSRRGAEDSFTAILQLIKHGLETIAGSDAHP
jgi:molybdenum cofactor synthesis domain-containing protein